MKIPWLNTAEHKLEEIMCRLLVGKVGLTTKWVHAEKTLMNEFLCICGWKRDFLRPLVGITPQKRGAVGPNTFFCVRRTLALTHSGGTHLFDDTSPHHGLRLNGIVPDSIRTPMLHPCHGFSTTLTIFTKIGFVRGRLRSWREDRHHVEK